MYYSNVVPSFPDNENGVNDLSRLSILKAVWKKVAKWALIVIISDFMSRALYSRTFPPMGDKRNLSSLIVPRRHFLHLGFFLLPVVVIHRNQSPALRGFRSF